MNVMINFLHTFYPNPVLLQIGWLKIHWYGFLIALGALAAFGIYLYLGRLYHLKKDDLYNLAFYLIIFGLIGDRLYYVFYAWEYYSQNLWDILKIWEGGLAIHGAMIAGLIVLVLYSRKHKLNPWQLLDILVVALALAMAIGRWGNYFNMELFGLPTDLAWGIPVLEEYRPSEFAGHTYFHPTFLYESLANFAIFIVLMLLHKLRLSKNKNPEKIKGFGNIALVYFLLYSLVRFLNEFLRLDYSPYLYNWRWAQIASLFIMISCLLVAVYKFWRWLNNRIRSSG